MRGGRAVLALLGGAKEYICIKIWIVGIAAYAVSVDLIKPQRQLPLGNRVGVNIGMCGVAGGFSGAPRCEALARGHFGFTLNIT